MKITIDFDDDIDTQNLNEITKSFKRFLTIDTMTYQDKDLGINFKWVEQ